MHPDWVHNLRNQCVAARIPFFFKHWGEYFGNVKIGRNKAGRLIENREWNQFPEMPYKCKPGEEINRIAFSYL
jgi:protein gp37